VLVASVLSFFSIPAICPIASDERTCT
jgi:hypothetical protein